MSYARILTRLTNTPLLIAEHKLAIISESVLIALANNKLPENMSPKQSGATVPTYNSDHLAMTASTQKRKVAIIQVYDSLVGRGGSAMSGLTSYSGIRRGINQALSEGATDIGFDIDSPGGEAMQ